MSIYLTYLRVLVSVFQVWGPEELFHGDTQHT